MAAAHAFPVEPAPIHVPDQVLDDLRARLTLTRPPLDEGNEDWSYGVPASYLRELVAYWRHGYDWRKAEAAINTYEHYGPFPLRWTPDVAARSVGRASYGRDTP